ncbi:Uncharacterised protein [Mycobacteroides abscessus subsp. abscessus]|nr:Uncharacterised protein [Mycobacteroides abscessus subsp. abscessus]
MRGPRGSGIADPLGVAAYRHEVLATVERNGIHRNPLWCTRFSSDDGQRLRTGEVDPAVGEPANDGIEDAVRAAGRDVVLR